MMTTIAGTQCGWLGVRLDGGVSVHMISSLGNLFLRKQYSHHVAYFVFKIRWWLHITDAEMSCNFQHKLYCWSVISWTHRLWICSHTKTLLGSTPCARPSKDDLIEFGLQWNLSLLQLKVNWSNRNEILYIPRQLCCLGMCKISLWLDRCERR